MPLLNQSNSRSKNPYFEIFVIAFFVALSFLLPYMIIDHGYFLFFGDYDVQQVPFYQLAHEAIRTGNTGWSWITDLGSNFVGSYSFYLLGSPFFWMTVPLPQALVPFTLGPLLAIKIALSAVIAYAYIRRFTKTNEMAILGGLLYAFSSFSIYDIFFNHFHEPMAFFPLLLIGLEEFMVNNRRGVFVLAVFINVLVNYVFFVGDAIFLVLYFVFRMLSDEWQCDFKKFMLLVFESVLGVGMGFILFLPSVLAVMGNYRTNNALSGWNLLVYNWEQRYPDIIHSFFFPQDLPSRPNFFPDSNAKWSSVAAWLPMFSMSGVIAFTHARRGNWVRRILAACLFITLIPGLNAAFILFNDDYNTRWFYMPVLMMALVTCIAIEDPKIDFKHGLKWTAVITLAFVGAIGLIPKMNGTKITGIGLEDDPLRFWAYVGIVVLGLTFVWVIYNKHGKNPAAFANSATIALTIIICIYGNFFIATGKEFGYDGSYFKQVAIDGAQNIKKDTSEFNRIDTPNSLDNQGMFWNWPTIYAFQSVVPPSIMEFYSAIGVQRDVASRPDTSFKGLRPFLSVKYLFDTSDAKTLNTPGWTYDGEQLGYSEFKDENFIPMGYTFDNYINEYEFDASPYKDQILLKGILLNDKQIEKYGNLFTKLDETDILYSDEEIASDAAARRSEACSTFTTDNAGFTSTINLSKDNLVFFTVPYDSGWTATVNGKKADIEKVDVGFMAVEGTKGNNTIRFVYTTPGLSTGLKVTIVSFGVVLLYLLIIFYLAVRKKKRALVVNQSNENILEELSEHTVNSDEANSDINEE